MKQGKERNEKIKSKNFHKIMIMPSIMEYTNNTASSHYDNTDRGCCPTHHHHVDSQPYVPTRRESIVIDDIAIALEEDDGELFVSLNDTFYASSSSFEGRKHMMSIDNCPSPRSTSDCMPIRPLRRTSSSYLDIDCDDDDDDDDDDITFEDDQDEEEKEEEYVQEEGSSNNKERIIRESSSLFLSGVNAFTVDPSLPVDTLPTLPTRRHSYSYSSLRNMIELTTVGNGGRNNSSMSSITIDDVYDGNSEQEVAVAAKNTTIKSSSDHSRPVAATITSTSTFVPPPFFSFKGMMVPQRRRYKSEPVVAQQPKHSGCGEDDTTNIVWLKSTKQCGCGMQQLQPLLLQPSQRQSRRDILRKSKSKSLSDIRCYKIKKRSDKVNIKNCYGGSPDILANRKRKCTSNNCSNRSSNSTTASTKSASTTSSSRSSSVGVASLHRQTSVGSYLHTINETPVDDHLESSLSNFDDRLFLMQSQRRKDL